MNKDLDELLCLLDGKITSYRMKHKVTYMDDKKLIDTETSLHDIQRQIQKMWDENRE